MGLLDALGSDDARLGIGLLAAGGYSPTPMSLGQRVQMAMQGMDAQKQNQLKTKLMQSQIDENSSQNATRAAALDKQLQLSKMVQTLFGGGADAQPATSPGAFTPSTDGMGPTMPPSMQAPQGQGGSRLAGMNIDQVAGLKALGGPDLFEAYKWTKDPLQLQQGNTYVDRTTGQSKFMPKVGEGIAPDANGFYAPLPGYAASQGVIEGAKTSATEGAKANYEMVDVLGPNGETRSVPKSSVLGGQGAAPRQAPTAGEADMRTAVQGGMGADPQAIQREIQQTTADLAKVADPASKAQLQNYLADLQAQAQRVPVATAQAPGVQRTQTTAQKLSAEAGGKVNETWLRTSYEPVIASMGPTDDMLAGVRVARNAITQMGGTGWGTETKAAAANVLNGLGLSTANSKMLATSSQVFQNAAMERLQSVLNAAKGPQTEGDATRAMKTFGQLGNTTEANNFILDLSEAKAQRDKMKAAFYQQALPIAQKKGDLAEIDREWSKRAPSIFSLPGMTKWGVK
jgi:hypothetical protein